MAKRMLIDASHPEEVRVVVLDGNRLEEFDFETSSKKQLKGNVYLAKVTRVEPSLQAAFVEYGGNRHGFLAFGEVHPDYFRIPIADRERLIAEIEAETAKANGEGGERPQRRSPATDDAGADAEPAAEADTQATDQPEEEATTPSPSRPRRTRRRRRSPATGAADADAGAGPTTASDTATAGTDASPAEAAETAAAEGSAVPTDAAAPSGPAGRASAAEPAGIEIPITVVDASAPQTDAPTEPAEPVTAIPEAQSDAGAVGSGPGPEAPTAAGVEERAGGAPDGGDPVAPADELAGPPAVDGPRPDAERPVPSTAPSAPDTPPAATTPAATTHTDESAAEPSDQADRPTTDPIPAPGNATGSADGDNRDDGRPDSPPDPPKSIAMAVDQDKDLVVSEPVTPAEAESDADRDVAAKPGPADDEASRRGAPESEPAAVPSIDQPAALETEPEAAPVAPEPDRDAGAPLQEVGADEADDERDNRDTTRGRASTRVDRSADSVPALIDAFDRSDEREDGGDQDTGPEPEPPEPNGTDEESYETVGGDEAEESQLKRRMLHNRLTRSYKIQEVIKRRQIMLVQVNKEERGNKGAALTSYLSLAGRYCVLMPNTPKGGGISRKIANPKDRKKMKEILSDLEVPDGMAVILRTAGLERTKAEIKRDFEYLLRLWDSIRETTLQSTAPALIHEEANLIKRAIRDLYTRDVDEVLVAGEDGYRIAKDFMKMLMPSHAKKVQQYRDPIPLLQRYQVESQIDALHNPTVQLKSGGYVVINPTEALVAIDVNSGRSTKERNIEETAYKTNLEAAEEIARQLRLRDLAGLIVIDFIDMEDDRHNAAVERKLKEAMKQDRARVQIGRISGFGLLELSRQRLRPSLMEAHFEVCGACKGTGVIRSLPSAALTVLRAIEEEGLRGRASEITVQTPTTIALYILNQKRDALLEIEARYGMRVQVEGDDTIQHPDYRIHKSKARSEEDAGPAVDAARLFDDQRPTPDLAEDEEPEAAETVETDGEPGGEDERGRRRRRRRRRRGRDRSEDALADEGNDDDAGADDDDDTVDEADASEEGDETADEDGDAGSAARRRRGRRGGRRRSGNRRGDEGGDEPQGDQAAVAAQEAGGGAADIATAEATSEQAEAGDTPKRRRVRRRRRASEPGGEGEQAGAEVSAGTGAAEAGQEPAPSASASDDAAAPTEEDASPSAAEPEAVGDDGVPVPDGERSATKPQETIETEPGSESVAASEEPEPGVAALNRPPERPRRGWWQRLTGG